MFYPGLASHPDHAIARAQMTGFGGMVCFEVPGGLDGASRVFDRFQVIRRATSLGGVDSLVSLPVAHVAVRATATRNCSAPA